MSKNLADFIERFILGKFLDNQQEHILMRRNDLAIELSCAPSQISYVLNTRFTLERGFVVESRRGAGGFVRIARIVAKNAEKDFLNANANQIVDNIFNTKAISKREHALLIYLLEMNMDRFNQEQLLVVLKEALNRMKENS